MPKISNREREISFVISDHHVGDVDLNSVWIGINKCGRHERAVLIRPDEAYKMCLGIMKVALNCGVPQAESDANTLNDLAELLSENNLKKARKENG